MSQLHFVVEIRFRLAASVYSKWKEGCVDICGWAETEGWLK